MWCSRPDPAGIRITEFLEAGGLRSIEDYAAWLKHNIYYQKSQGYQEWSAPEKVLDRRFGDCKDYSARAWRTRAAVRCSADHSGVRVIEELAEA